MQNVNVMENAPLHFRPVGSLQAHRSIRRPLALQPRLAVVPDTAAKSPSPASDAGSWHWIANLHIGAARRWLSFDPPRFEQVEASLRNVARTCAPVFADASANLETNAAELARSPGVRELLDGLSKMTAADRG